MCKTTSLSCPHQAFSLFLTKCLCTINFQSEIKKEVQNYRNFSSNKISQKFEFFSIFRENLESLRGTWPIVHVTNVRWTLRRWQHVGHLRRRDMSLMVWTNEMRATREKRPLWQRRIWYRFWRRWGYVILRYFNKNIGKFSTTDLNCGSLISNNNAWIIIVSSLFWSVYHQNFFVTLK